MNSSISTSETGWRRVLCLYAVWTVIVGLLAAILVLALDPYDTGHFALFPSRGVPHFGQRLAGASLGRQSRFNAAIIGNSTIQLIDPSRLKNVRAVSLAIPGTGPREQLFVAEYFLRHHPGAGMRAFVFGLDERWCGTGQASDLTHPFPFWLYSDDTAGYVINMMQYQNLESAGRKISLLRGKAQPLRADGYNDYDAGRTWDRAAFVQRLDAPAEEGAIEPASAPPYIFASASLLSEFIARLPPQTKVILAMPPQFHKNMTGYAGTKQRACEKTFSAIAQQRPHAEFINFLDRPGLTTRDEDFWDHEHYRASVARVMEGEIGLALSGK